MRTERKKPDHLVNQKGRSSVVSHSQTMSAMAYPQTGQKPTQSNEHPSERADPDDSEASFRNLKTDL